MRQNRFFVIPNDDKKRIIIQEGKHGNDYYDASTQADADASLLKIFKSNDDVGYYEYDGIHELEAEVAELEKQAQTLPPGLSQAHYKIQEDAKRNLISKKRDLAQAKADAELMKRAKKGDVEAVAEFLWKRRDGEYEGIRVEELQ